MKIEQIPILSKFKHSDIYRTRPATWVNGVCNACRYGGAGLYMHSVCEESCAIGWRSPATFPKYLEIKQEISHEPS